MFSRISYFAAAYFYSVVIQRSRFLRVVSAFLSCFLSVNASASRSFNILCRCLVLVLVDALNASSVEYTTCCILAPIALGYKSVFLHFYACVRWYCCPSNAVYAYFFTRVLTRLSIGTKKIF